VMENPNPHARKLTIIIHMSGRKQVRVAVEL
jgi:hypothetical protein